MVVITISLYQLFWVYGSYLICSMQVLQHIGSAVGATGSAKAVVGHCCPVLLPMAAVIAVSDCLELLHMLCGLIDYLQPAHAACADGCEDALLVAPEEPNTRSCLQQGLGFQLGSSCLFDDTGLLPARHVSQHSTLTCPTPHQLFAGAIMAPVCSSLLHSHTVHGLPCMRLVASRACLESRLVMLVAQLPTSCQQGWLQCKAAALLPTS